MFFQSLQQQIHTQQLVTVLVVFIVAFCVIELQEDPSSRSTYGYQGKYDDQSKLLRSSVVNHPPFLINDAKNESLDNVFGNYSDYDTTEYYQNKALHFSNTSNSGEDTEKGATTTKTGPKTNREELPTTKKGQNETSLFLSNNNGTDADKQGEQSVLLTFGSTNETTGTGNATNMETTSLISRLSVTNETKEEEESTSKKEQNTSLPLPLLTTTSNNIDNDQDKDPVPIQSSLLFTLDSTNETFESSTMRRTRDMETLSGEGIQDESMCDYVRNSLNRTNPDSILVFNRTNDYGICHDWVSGNTGTGNVFVSIVGQRLAALAETNTAWIFDCGFDANSDDVKRSDIMPWVSGYFPASRSFDQDHLPLDMQIPAEYCPKARRRTFKSPSSDHVYGSSIGDLISTGDQLREQRRLYNSMPLKFMKPLISYDLRRMAIALVGSVKDSPNHPSAIFEQNYLIPEAKEPPFTPINATGGTIYKVPIHGYFQNGPLFPGVKLDDVVIHYRCGDILLPGAFGPFYFPKFEEYTKLISPEARSVGIVTQPFSSNDPSSQTRKRDKTDESGVRCKVLVGGLVDYIYEHCPNIAENEGGIHIHNGPNETVALAYARLVMANQTLSLFPSTFSSMPTLATFGTGYVTKPALHSKGSFANTWLKHPMSNDLYPNEPVEVPIYENMLYANHLKDMWQYGDEFVLEWFRNTSIPAGRRIPN